MNTSTLQISPSEVLSDVHISWTIQDGRVVIELSHRCARCPGDRRLIEQGYACGWGNCDDGRVRETLTPQGLRRRVGIEMYKKVCDEIRDAMSRGNNSDG